MLAEHDDQPHIALLRHGAWQATPGANVAREPRDTIGISTTLPADAVAPAGDGIGRLQVRAAGAAMRAIMIAGVLEAITGMTVQYAQDRVQFGRPIGKFQAIQHNLAILASQAAAAGAAADMAAEAVADGIRIPAIAAAKSRAGEAASIAAGLAHQIHGAIGFTYEHRLHFFTKRLWAWRDEYGGEAEWSLLLGRHMAPPAPTGCGRKLPRSEALATDGRKTYIPAMDDTPRPAENPDPLPETAAEEERRLAWEAEMIAEADADIAAGRLVDSAKVKEWIDSIGTDNELPVPYSGR